MTKERVSPLSYVDRSNLARLFAAMVVNDGEVDARAIGRQKDEALLIDVEKRGLVERVRSKRKHIGWRLTDLGVSVVGAQRRFLADRAEADRIVCSGKALPPAPVQAELVTEGSDG